MDQPHASLPATRKRLLIAAGAGTLLLACALVWWYWSARHPSTDDALLRAHYVWIRPQVSGAVIELYVHENEFVKAGQPLFKIDPRPYQQAVAEATAKLALTKAEIAADTDAVAAAQAIVNEQQAGLDLAEQRFDRLIPLVEKKVLDQLTGAQVTSTYVQARAAVAEAVFRLEQAKRSLGDPGTQKARLNAAEAALALAQLRLDWTLVTAPSDGTVTQFNLRVGDVLEPGDTLFPFIESGTWWVQANYKETDVKNIRPNMRATVKVDMYGGRKFEGVVHSLSAGSAASFSLLPPQNTTGNYVKVTQRIPVRVHLPRFDVQAPFRMGASCEVTIDLATGSGSVSADNAE